MHRALLAELGLDDAAPRAHELEEEGVEASAREREAMTIERDADDVCLAFLLERALAEQEPGARFEGEVVGLIAKGAFVRFGEEGFEGFLPVRRLRGWWEINELGTALEAENGGRLRFGDPHRGGGRPRRSAARARRFDLHMKKLIPLLALLSLLAVPASASAATDSARSGDVRASLTYNCGSGTPYNCQRDALPRPPRARQQRRSSTSRSRSPATGPSARATPTATRSASPTSTPTPSRRSWSTCSPAAPTAA